MWICYVASCLVFVCFCLLNTVNSGLMDTFPYDFNILEPIREVLVGFL